MKKLYVQVGCVFLLMVTLVFHINSQCTITGPFQVNDFDVFDLTMEIEGLAKNDMSDPDQGICGVALEFEHERVGNLLIELSSPSGQVVTLIGPNGPFGLTNFTTWDISLLPCASAVDPDQNFGPFYTNQNSWGNFGNYTGSYYPFDGCMEDFNSGAANGDWTFTIRDAYQFDEGEIKSITLFFCDPTGLECQECAVPEIEWLDDSLELCSASLPSDTFDWNIEANYNPNLHDYTFVTTQNDTLINISDTAAIPAEIDSGDYMFCGFSYEKADSAEVLQFLQTAPLLSEAIDSIEEAGYCYRLSEECLIVLIDEPIDTIVIDTSLCLGDTLFWYADTITQAGQYAYTDTVSTVCPLHFVLDVSPLNLNARVSTFDTLNCERSTQLINAFSSDFTANTNIRWLYNNSIIAQDTLQISVATGGIYHLILEEMSCADTLEFEVYENFQQPYLEFGAVDSLKCGVDSVHLIADSTTAPTSFFITQSGDTIHSESVYATSPDTFIYVAVGDNGCTNTETIIVFGDNRMVNLQIDTAVNLCGTDRIQLQLIRGDSTHNYFWEGPAGFTANARDTFAFVEGVYMVRATHPGSNCTSLDSFDYQFLPPLDTPEIVSDSLSCLQNSIQIQLDSVYPAYEYLWIAPSGDSVMESEPFVTEAGIYYLEIKSSRNCRIQLQHEVIQSLNLPDLLIKGDTLDCSAAPALLVASSSPADSSFSFEWKGPSGKIYSNDSAFVHVPGTYIITLTKDSICQVVDSFELTESFNAFPHVLSADSLNCIDTISNISISGPDSFTYIWMGPNGFVEIGREVSTQEGGVYSVQIETESCIYNRNIAVVADNQAPEWNLEINDFTCARDTASVIQSGDEGDRFWVYSEDSMKYIYLESDTFLSLQSGEYSFRLLGQNACINDTITEITYDTLSGPYTVEFLDTFSCIQDSIEAIVHTDAVDISWVQNGIEIGEGDRIWIEQPTELSLNMQFENACQQNAIIEVPVDTLPAIPQFNAIDLNCAINSYTLDLTIEEEVDQIHWNAPDTSFETTDTSFYIETIGGYEISTIAKNGCQYDTSFIVQLDTALPSPTFQNDTISCTDSTVTIEVIIDTSQLNEYYWRLNDGVLLYQLNPSLPEGRHRFVFQGKNACRDSVYKSIYVDSYEAEAGNLPDSLTLNCDSSEYTVRPDLPADAVSVEWILPDDNSLFTPTIDIDSPGEYRFIMYNNEGCGDTALIYVNIDTVAPSVLLFGDTLNCRQASVMLRHETSESGLGYSWMGPNGFQSQMPNPLISEGGIYRLELSDRGGCVTVDSVRIWEDFELPEYSLADTFFSSCNTGLASVFVTTTSDQIAWYFNNQVVANTDSFSTDKDGLFRVIITGSNGCRAIDSVWVSAKGKRPYAQWNAPTLNCNNLKDTIVLSNAEGDYSYQWEGPSGFSSFLPSPIIPQEGMYTVHIEDDLGCDTTFTIEVEQTSYPISVDFNVLNEIRCEDSIAPVIATIDHELKDTLINWRALQGNIINGASSLETELKGPGVFVIQVTDTVDNCSVTDTLTITKSEKPNLEIYAEVQDKVCDNDRGTFIKIVPEDSSRAPFQYSIEDEDFQEKNKYLNLLPATYTVRVKDKQGCIYDASFSIEDQTEESQVYLGEDRDVAVGDEIIVHPEINVHSEAIDSFEWAINGDTLCVNCDSLEVLIDRSKKVEIFVYTKGGCTLYDQINLLAPTDQVLFVPNIFSPNNDGTNDIFYIQTQLDIDRIEHLQIFDRWGNRVFEARNFPPNDRIHGWDGTFEGKTLFPQVLAVRIVFDHEGERKIEHYDLMLMH